MITIYSQKSEHYDANTLVLCFLLKVYVKCFFIFYYIFVLELLFLVKVINFFFFFLLYHGGVPSLINTERA